MAINQGRRSVSYPSFEAEHWKKDAHKTVIKGKEEG